MEQTLTKKEQTRNRILDAAGQGFRSQGYAGIGVDGIAKAAGVTSGAFYAHFGSKDAAFQEALIAGLGEVIEEMPKFQRKSGLSWVTDFADYYLGRPHRDDLACGCAMTTLTPEMARASKELRKIYELKMGEIADIFAEGLADGSKTNRLGRAWAMLAVLTGGLNITRAVDTPDLANYIADSLKKTVVQIAGETRDLNV